MKVDVNTFAGDVGRQPMPRVITSDCQLSIDVINSVAVMTVNNDTCTIAIRCGTDVGVTHLQLCTSHL